MAIGHNLAIDLVFFINGVPVATVEVKTDFTQSAAAAIEQYKLDRQPVDPVTKRKEPLLTFKRGAVVHFALSDSDIRMATKLDGLATHFLPFNLGRGGHAGNPLRDDGDGSEVPAERCRELCERADETEMLEHLGAELARDPSHLVKRPADGSLRLLDPVAMFGRRTGARIEV